jgi:uncharacterized membrane protein
MWLSTAPMFQQEEPETAAGADRRFASAEGFAEVQDIVLGRCSMCHAAEPVWEGILWPPRGVRLDTEYHIARNAREIYLQAGLSHAMPPANLSMIEPDERATIVAWYEAAIGG